MQLGAGETEGVRAAYGSVLAMLDILGLDPAAPQWADGASASGDLTPVVDALVTTLLDQRAEARAAKDWATADAIRDSLAASGLTITDTKDGARWSLERG